VSYNVNNQNSNLINRPPENNNNGKRLKLFCGRVVSICKIAVNILLAIIGGVIIIAFSPIIIPVYFVTKLVKKKHSCKLPMSNQKQTYLQQKKPKTISNSVQTPQNFKIPKAQPAKLHRTVKNNSNAIYTNLKPYNDSATLENWQTIGGAGTASWLVSNDRSFKQDKHKIGVVVAANHGLPLGGLTDSTGQKLKETITTDKLKLKTQEETVTANWMITSCGTDYEQQNKQANDTVFRKWGLKEEIHANTDTETIQGIDYTTSIEPHDYSDCWIVEDACLTAVSDYQLLEGSESKVNLIFSAGPNAKISSDPTGSMQRTANILSFTNYQHFKECIKSALRGSLDAAAKTNISHVLLAPISCGIYAGTHKTQIRNDFNEIIKEILDEEVGPNNEPRSNYFVKVILSDIQLAN